MNILSVLPATRLPGLREHVRAEDRGGVLYNSLLDKELHLYRTAGARYLPKMQLRPIQNIPGRMEK